MKKFFLMISAFLLAHPAFEHFLEAGIYASFLALIAYVKTTGLAGGDQTFNAGVAGVAVMTALKIYIKANQTQILAFLQDQLQALDGTNGQAPILAAVAQVPKPSNGALTPIAKMLLIGFLALAFTSNSFAWEVPAKPFGMDKQKLSISQPPAGGEVDGVFMPTASLGLGVGNSATPSYGVSGAYDFVIGRVTAVDASNVNITPFIGIGGAIYVDAGPWLSSNLSSPIVASGGFNIIGPDLAGTVPGAQHTWNLQTGEQKTLITWNVPFDIFSDQTITKVFGF